MAVTHITYEKNAACAKAVIDLSGPVEFSRKNLRRSERVYFDLKNVRMGDTVKRVYPVDGALVQAIRVRQFNRETVRIVFDLKTDRYDVTAVLLKSPDRISVQICRKQQTKIASSKPSLSNTQTLVPRESWITDDAARLALARILSYDDRTLDDAIMEYRILVSENPNNALERLEMARVLIRKGNTKEALSILRQMRTTHPEDTETLVALADLEATLGHAARSRDLYRKALQISDQPKTMKLKFADRMNTWGDFHKAEAIYKDHLSAHPQERDTLLQLAALLRSSERYGESEGVYKQLLLASPDSRELLLELARLKLLEKDFDAAENQVEQFLELDPGNPEGLLLKADIRLSQKQYEEALGIYSKLSKMKCCGEKGLLGVGKVYLEEGKEDLAISAFMQTAKAHPQSVAARFYAAGFDEVTSEDFVDVLLKDPAISPITLDQWAKLYAQNGYNRIAIKCYEAALKRDTDYFPSQLGLAEILAIDHQYDRATRQFEALAQTFPKNRKILMGWARALGWGRQYDESIAMYDKIHEIAPLDPVPRMEKARTAVWGKDMDTAQETYETLLRPPVDEALAASLEPVVAASGNSELTDAASRLTDRAEKGSVFQGFEQFTEELKKIQPALSSNTRRQIDAILTRLHPAFVIQKLAYLEGRAKGLAWNKRRTRAMDAYEELMAFAPGNQEAIFDYAQLECATGLCDREAKTYRKLLDLDKLHSLASKALKRQEIRSNPSLKAGQIYWAERGRNGLTEIDRYRTDLEVDVPVGCRFHLRLASHHWIEHPSFNDTSYGANGFTLGVGGVLTPYIRGEAGWTRKYYQDNELQNTDTGYAHIWFNLRDYAEVGLGYDRTDELYNYFGIKQGIQANSWWLTVNSDITRRLEVQGIAKYMGYNDDNAGRLFLLGAGYAFTDHPRIFKIALTGEYRDTLNHDVYQYEDGQLVNIIHPYWTPQNYVDGTVTFEWYHDVSDLFFCGSELHFYDLALTLGTDTESNPAVGLRGKWHYEFLEHWTLNLTGLIHRSRLWDAEGIWADIRYQF